jgi:tetratricopeptide (TPR) repeat protein
MGLSRLPQAEKYLSQAQWLMLKNVSCDNSVKCLVFRQLGLLYTAQGQYEKARLTLADDIYHASMKYGCLDIRVAGGYFHLGNVFFHENQLEVANSLHDQVLALWRDFFVQAFESQTVVRKPTDSQSPMSSQISVVEVTKPSLDSNFCLDVPEQIEAIQMLQAIRLSREEQASSDEDPSHLLHLMNAYYTLALLYHYLGNQPQMVEYAEKAIQLSNSQETPDMDFREKLTVLLNRVS